MESAPPDPRTPTVFRGQDFRFVTCSASCSVPDLSKRLKRVHDARGISFVSAVLICGSPRYTTPEDMDAVYRRYRAGALSEGRRVSDLTPPPPEKLYRASLIATSARKVRSSCRERRRTGSLDGSLIASFRLAWITICSARVGLIPPSRSPITRYGFPAVRRISAFFSRSDRPHALTTADHPQSLCRFSAAAWAPDR